MEHRIESRRLTALMGARRWIVAIAMCIAIWPATTTASTIALGWDLFITNADDSMFGGVGLEGVRNPTRIPWFRSLMGLAA